MSRLIALGSGLLLGTWLGIRIIPGCVLSTYSTIPRSDCVRSRGVQAVIETNEPRTFSGHGGSFPAMTIATSLLVEFTVSSRYSAPLHPPVQPSPIFSCGSLTRRMEARTTGREPVRGANLESRPSLHTDPAFRASCPNNGPREVPDEGGPARCRCKAYGDGGSQVCQCIRWSPALLTSPSS